MKPIGIVYIIVGIAAIIGAIGAAYVAFTLWQALGIINSANPADIPAGTDLATLQASTRSLSTLIVISFIWIVSVILSGAFSIRLGIKTLRSKK